MRLPQNPRKIRVVGLKFAMTTVQQTAHPDVSPSAREREDSGKKGFLRATAAALKPQRVGEETTARRRRVSRADAAGDCRNVRRCE
jgi:hypothetical protein